MKQELTLAIIKPLAIKKGYTGPIITQIEKAGFEIKVIVSLWLSEADAQNFYAIHAKKPFYERLCKYISSGKIIVLALQKENAIQDFRTLIGSTEPSQAAEGTLRKQFGEDINHNAIHGSDGPATAKQEIEFFFGPPKEGKQTCQCKSGQACGGNCACRSST